MEHDKYIFKTPALDKFKNETDRQEYLDRCRCTFCGKKLQDGDNLLLWEYCAPMTPEEAGSRNVPATVAHSKCIDENLERS